MTTFPLAVYTAGHGLDWNYPKGEIPFETLDSCRKAFGSLPDFDAGEKGFEGVWVTADRVFVLRCQSVRAWDFRGRDATYLSVTWVSRTESPEIDFEKLLRSNALRVPTKTPPAFFETDATKDLVARTPSNVGRGLDDFSCVSDIIATVSPEDELLFKRTDGTSGVSCVVRPNRDICPQTSRKCRDVPAQRQEECGFSERRGEQDGHRQPMAVCLVALTLLWIVTAVAGGFACLKLRQANRRCETLRNEVGWLERKLFERQVSCPYLAPTRLWTQGDCGLNIIQQ